MTSKEKILAAFNHKNTNIIPIDFSGHRSSGIMVQAYKKLREYLGLPASKLYIYDFIQQLALVEDDVLDLVGADVVELGHGFFEYNDYWQDWELDDGTACKIPAFINVQKTDDGNIVFGDEGQIICIQMKGCLYFEQTFFPLLNSDDESFGQLPNYLSQVMWSRIGVPPAPAGFDENGAEILRHTAVDLSQKTSRAIYGTFGGSLFEIGNYCFRMDNFLAELALNPSRIHTFLDKLTLLHLQNLTKYLNAVGDYIDIIGFGDDLGMQTGPMISPAMYREFFKPRHKALWGFVKKFYPHLKICLHCCGGIYPLIPDLIESGLDAINPVQFVCKDMELTNLKKEFGKDIVFWGGGCDTREVLQSKTPEEIKRHVRDNTNTMNIGGGFIFQQVHNIMANVSPENIMAMFEAVNRKMGAE